jgi:hypothetical protein
LLLALDPSHPTTSTTTRPRHRLARIRQSYHEGPAIAPCGAWLPTTSTRRRARRRAHRRAHRRAGPTPDLASHLRRPGCLQTPDATGEARRGGFARSQRAPATSKMVPEQ